MARLQRGRRRGGAVLAVALAAAAAATGAVSPAIAVPGEPTAPVPVVRIQEQRSVAVDDAVQVSVFRMSVTKPVTIRWGDGTTTRVRSDCSSQQAVTHPHRCAAVARHSYRSAGVFRIVVSRAPRLADRAVLRVGRAANPSVSAGLAVTWREDMLDRVNALRKKADAPPVVLCAPLQATAQDYSSLMATSDYYGHVGPDGSEPWDRMSAHGYAWHGAGENIAAGFDDVDAVMTAWQNSPGHMANILNPSFTHVGFGQARDDSSRYRTYWVQNFGYGGACSVGA